MTPLFDQKLFGVDMAEGLDVDGIISRLLEGLDTSYPYFSPSLSLNKM